MEAIGAAAELAGRLRPAQQEQGDHALARRRRARAPRRAPAGAWAAGAVARVEHTGEPHRPAVGRAPAWTSSSPSDSTGSRPDVWLHAVRTPLSVIGYVSGTVRSFSSRLPTTRCSIGSSSIAMERIVGVAATCAYDRSMTALLVVLASVVAVAAAIRSTWSPCGLSMLSTITPLAERGRSHRYASTAAWFVVGAVARRATLGARRRRSWRPAWRTLDLTPRTPLGSPRLRRGRHHRPPTSTLGGFRLRRTPAR